VLGSGVAVPRRYRETAKSISSSSSILEKPKINSKMDKGIWEMVLLIKSSTEK